MHNIEFKSEVYDDIKMAYDWYEQQKIGLGEDFLLMLEDSYSQISKMPKSYQTVYKTVRRKLIRRFPYGIFFVIQDEKIIVIAIMHTKRKPSSWNDRT